MLAPVPGQERGLAGGHQPVGCVRPEGGAGRVESEGAETAAAEETVLTPHRSIACSTLGQVIPVLSSFSPGSRPRSECCFRILLRCGGRTPRPASSCHLRGPASGAFPQMALFFFHHLVTTFASTEKVGARNASR